MGRLFLQLEEARGTLKSLHDRERDRASRLDYLRFQHEELERVDPVSGELEEIEVELSKLKSLDLLKGAAQQGGEVLYDGDEAVFEKLSAVAQSLAEAARHDPVLAKSAETLTDAAASVEDIARFLSKYERNLEADPERLEALEDRRETLTTPLSQTRNRSGRRHCAQGEHRRGDSNLGGLRGGARRGGTARFRTDSGSRGVCEKALCRAAQGGEKALEGRCPGAGGSDVRQGRLRSRGGRGKDTRSHRLRRGGVSRGAQPG